MEKKEYPKMIYKGGDANLGNLKVEHCVVNNYDHHMIQLEIWGEKRPDDGAKTPEKSPEKKAKVAKGVETGKDDEKSAPVAADSKTEEKPKRAPRKPRAKAKG